MTASLKRKRKTASRLARKRGYTMAEFAPTLMIVFAIIIFPMLAFGTLGVRYVFLVNAARLAAQSASRCQTFKTDLAANNLGSITTALNVSKTAVKGIGGNTVVWVGTNTSIFICPMGSTTVTSPGVNTPLPTPADPVNNAYNCVVRVHATLQPVFPGWSGLLGSIPGLNAPIDAWAQGENFFENTQNLNQ